MLKVLKRCLLKNNYFVVIYIYIILSILMYVMCEICINFCGKGNFYIFLMLILLDNFNLNK